MEKAEKVWIFIEDQYVRFGENLTREDYKSVIDLVYDIIGNISNLYLLLEKNYFSTDKGKLLNTLQEMYKVGVFSEDYSKFFKEKWRLRNLAKYGFFSAEGIEEIKIEKSEVVDLFNNMKKLFSEFSLYRNKGVKTL